VLVICVGCAILRLRFLSLSLSLSLSFFSLQYVTKPLHKIVTLGMGAVRSEWTKVRREYKVHIRPDMTCV
jgi:hypothetical protein